MLAYVLAMSLVGFQDWTPPETDLPVVEQEVECISIAHFYGDSQVAYFWDVVQGDWTLLETKWHDRRMEISSDGESWVLQWPDDGDHCYRVIRTKCWVESFEAENPMIAMNRNVPWFRQLLQPGLKKPPAKK